MVLHTIGFANGNNLYEKLYNQAVGMIILACAGSILGYWTAVLTMDTVGRKPLQVFGFLSLTAVFCVLGFRLGSLSEGAILGLYVVGQFLFSAGSNTTTFIVPGECFPTGYRATGHGLSAAMGKLGAVVAQVISIPLLRPGSDEACAGNDCSPKLDRLLKLFALFMLLGTFVSLLIPETKGLTLEEIAGESKTSYKAGCNGSIGTGSASSGLRNPLGAGRPAGFLYPGYSPVTAALKGDSPGRAGIAAGAAAAESDGQRRRRRRLSWRWRSRRRRAGSGGSNEIALRSRSSRSEGHDDNDEDMGAATSQQLPEWGAGWGKTDRDGSLPTMGNMQLQDVGMLLKPS